MFDGSKVDSEYTYIYTYAHILSLTQLGALRSVFPFGKKGKEANGIWFCAL